MTLRGCNPRSSGSGSIIAKRDASREGNGIIQAATESKGTWETSRSTTLKSTT
jgi:hypothetical protein